MPWEFILGAGGVSGIIVSLILVLTGNYVLKVLERMIEGSRIRLEADIRRTEEAFKNTLTLASQIDQDLRERRMNVYPKLWEMTQLLPLWPRAENATYGDLQQFSLELQNWYFHEGGMYLSEISRSAYGNVQEAIKALAGRDIQSVLHPDDYEAVRLKCSAMRTELARDIQSRRASPLSP